MRITPRHDGGLLGGAEVAWDAEHGVPLRAAVYANGAADPVLELKATDIAFGKVAAATSPSPSPRAPTSSTSTRPRPGARPTRSTPT